MRKLLLISVLFCASTTIHAQNFNCTTVAQREVTLYAKNALPNVNTLKTIRIIVHFPLKTNGTYNFTETKDCNGKVSNDNGYWFAEKFIERANYCLQHNVKMRQRLSYRDIDSIPINIQFELSGVVFHRNDNLFDESNATTTGAFITMHNQATKNIDPSTLEDAIHVFLYKYKGEWGYGRADLPGNVCVVSGVDMVYNNYIDSNRNDWWFDGRIVRFALHEIGHCLSLKHPKYNYRDKNDSRNYTYDDDCYDTPTFKELINDGFEDPCVWNGEKSSNNVMDYNASQAAWTPDQIELVHKNIAQRKYLYPTAVKTNTSTVTGYINQGNKVVIAKNVTAKNVTVPKDRALYINCDEFQTNGEFEVKLGAQLEIK